MSQDFEAQLFSTSVRHEVAFGMEQLGVERGEMARRLTDALAVVGLAGFDGRDPITLSGGEKQRLAIAALLALEPAVLVLDEPTTDLDPLGKRDVFAALAAVRARGATILLIEHETAAAERADRLVLMAGGAIVADGPPAPLLADVDRLEHLGVRPLDLDRIAEARGWAARPGDVTAAAQRLRARPAAAPAVPAAAREPLVGAERPGARVRAGPPGARRRLAVDRRRRVRGPHRAERLRQDDAGQMPERADHARSRAPCGCAAPTCASCR